MSNRFQKFWIELDAAGKRQLVEKSGLSHSFLSQIAHGHRNAGKSTIEKLVAAHPEITLAMFFETAA